MCTACRRRRHYHPQPCPGCGRTRPLAYQLGQHDIEGQDLAEQNLEARDLPIGCADCAGVDSVFACRQCGSEAHPYGFNRCARCILGQRLTVLLTDPATGDLHHRLVPVFEELVGSDRPQSGLTWLNKKPGVGPRLLRQMARGQIEISHDTFRGLPSDRPHDYLRALLAAVGVLEPFDVRVERMTPWLQDYLATVPDHQGLLLRRYATWKVLPAMRRSAERGTLTQARANAQRSAIRMAGEFLSYLDHRGITVADADQSVLEDYQLQLNRKRLYHEPRFIAWLHTTGINRAMKPAQQPAEDPQVTVSEEHRWDIVDRLLHDTQIRRYTRLAGLFTLLFAQPLSRIVAMRTDQIQDHHGDGVVVTFADVPIQMPPVLDDLIREQVRERGKSLYASRRTGWLFPGGYPGTHISTEAIRSQLVEIGISPNQGRKAALYQLASDIPAPVLAELIGISTAKATQWAKLAGRDWRRYIASRS